MKHLLSFNRFPIFPFLLIIFTLPIYPIYGGTCVNGFQSGVWGPAGNPYIVIGGVTVLEGDTLIIQPGTIILISPQASGGGGIFRVEGTIIAQGQPGNRIVFSGLDLESVITDQNTGGCSGVEKAEPGSWTGLQLFTPGPGSILNYCDIRYAGRDGSPTININSSGFEDRNMTIANCRITNGDGDGIKMNTGASPTIINTLLEGHAKSGMVELINSCHPLVEGCALVNNGGYAAEAYAGNVANYIGLFISGNQPNGIRVTSEPLFVSAEWLDHGVPYYFNRGGQSAIQVAEEATLTLEPGVEIRMAATYGFDIAGTLIADGDSCRWITFTAIDTMVHWERLTFKGGSAGRLNYVDYSFGKGINLLNVDNRVEISNCRITRNLDKGLEVRGTSAPLIRNNLISGHAEEGIWLATTAGYIPQFRRNLIKGNREGMRVFSSSSTADLGTADDPGHNSFIDHEGYALIHQGADTLWAIGNYWVATDSATIAEEYIFDKDDSTTFGPVIFVPFDDVDRSEPPVPGICPPSCQALSISITRPTIGGNWTTSARFLPLGGSAVDDRGVATITWSNAATGQSGEARLSNPRTDCTWDTAPIALLAGANLITVTATDQDGCTATDQITVTFDEDATGCWLADAFDELQQGPLDGQSGWSTVAGRVSAQVIANPYGMGQVLLLDPPADEPVIMEKAVAAQSSGTHNLELLVLVEPGDTSMAKIEVKTSGNPAWDKKFQLYFGQTMRLNYGPTRPEAVFFLLQTEARRWYHVRALIDLGTDLVDIFVDGLLVLDDIAVGPGAIEGVSISGWNFPGFVLYDDLKGCEAEPIVSAPSLQDASPGLRLWQNFPNPFAAETTIGFELPNSASVTLSVHDLLGREVTRLVATRLPAGTHQVVWNGRSGDGRLLPPGIYVYRLKAGETVQARRMILGEKE